MKRILVTGGNGQLGSELRQLATAYPEFEFRFVDIGDLDLLSADDTRKFIRATSYDFIINCAAYTAVDKAEEEVDLCRRVNADAVRVLAEAARDTKSRLVHISTDYVFDGEFNQPIDESAAPNPVSVYGKTKLEGEEHLRNILSDAYIIRTAWVYSTFGKNFVKTIANLARQKPELGIVADQVGTPTYARDLARAIMTMVHAVSTGRKDEPGTYHYSNEGTISWYDFAYFIREYYQLGCTIKPIRTWEYKTAATRPRYSVLDKTKIKTTFDLAVPHWSVSLKECLSKLEL